ncbi:hypothetical protein DY240_10655, partial [Jiangella rhizosphaerae]
APTPEPEPQPATVADAGGPAWVPGERSLGERLRRDTSTRKRATSAPDPVAPEAADPLTDPGFAEPARPPAEQSPHAVGDWDPFARAGVDQDAPRASIADAYKGRRAGRAADETSETSGTDAGGRTRRAPGKRAAGKRAKGRRQEDDQ